MAHPKSHIRPAQMGPNLDCRGRAKGELDFGTETVTLTMCARNSDIERCEGTVASDVSVLRSEFRQLHLPVPERALTQDHMIH